MSHHEDVPGVPKICEICFAPVVLSMGQYSVFFQWPAAFGLPVYAHVGECHDAAVKRIKKAGPRSLKDGS